MKDSEKEMKKKETEMKERRKRDMISVTPHNGLLGWKRRRRKKKEFIC
jgi:hypothetical protein